MEVPFFNQARAKFYPFNEVYLGAPKKGTKVAGDCLLNIGIRTSPIQRSYPVRILGRRVNRQVQYAVIHNQGKFKGGPPEEYWGFSSSGIEIHFYYVEGEIRSFFPAKQ